MMVKNENLIGKLIQTTDNNSFHISVEVFGENCVQAAIMNQRNVITKCFSKHHLPKDRK